MSGGCVQLDGRLLMVREDYEDRPGGRNYDRDAAPGGRGGRGGGGGGGRGRGTPGGAEAGLKAPSAPHALPP